MYDPSVGRFVSQDPLPGYISDPQSHNPYVYAGNAPTTFTDPTGAAITGSVVGICVDYCGEPPGGEFLLDAFVILGTGDMHYHLGGLGEDTGSVCVTCESVDRDIRSVDTTGTRESESTTTTGESDVGSGGARPVQIGKMGVKLSDDYLLSRGVRQEDIVHDLVVDTPLGPRVVDTYVKDGPMGRFIMETK